MGGSERGIMKRGKKTCVLYIIRVQEICLSIPGVISFHLFSNKDSTLDNDNDVHEMDCSNWLPAL